MVNLTDIIGTDIKLVEKQQGNVNSYAKYLLPHMITHYELFVRTTRSSQEAYSLTLEDLLAYHVYGDYVLVADGSRTKLTYHGNSGNGITGVTGIYEPPSDSDRTNIRYRNEEIKWLEEEIQRGSSGVRLMLPSLGTQVISTFGFGNIAKELREYLKKSLYRLNSFISSREDSSAPVTGFNYNGTEMNSDLDEKDYILQRLANDPALGFVKTTLDPLLSEATSFDDLLDEFLKEFIVTNVAKFAKDDFVYVKSVAKLTGSKKDALVNAVKEAMRYAPDDEVDLEFEEFKVTSVTPPLEGETRAEMRVSYMDEEVDYVFDHEDFRKSGRQDVDTGVTIKKGKKYYREPDAPTLERYRIFLDKMYEIQAALFVEHFGEKGDKTVPWYVSDRLIPSKNLKIMEKYFPEITRLFDEPQVQKKSIKKENSLIHTLCQHRLAITTTSLIAQRTLAFDKKMFDDFYNGDMLLKEINWLTAALTDWGRVVVEAEREGNPLAVVKGVPVGQDPRAPGNVVSIAEATRQLAIYRLEVPMLKQVINEYNSLYNAFTISNVFSMADGDPKEAQLAKALWGGITNRTVGIFDIPGVKPHVLFDRLFKEVSDVLSQKSSFGIDPYPPSWSDSQILGQLVRDPRYVLGDKPSIDDYKKYLKEYLEYLQSKYSSRWIVASAIISVVDNYRVNIATDADGLRKGFLKRIEGDAKKSTLKGRYIQFDAYGHLIAILRAQLSIPLDMRDDFIAKGIEKELGLVIKDRAFDEKRPVFAEGHPDYKAPSPSPSPGASPAPAPSPSPPSPSPSPSPSPAAEAIVEDEEELEAGGEVPFRYPSMNQIEVNPVLQQDDAIAASRERGIPVVAFSPMAGRSGILTNEIVTDIASELSVGPGEVLLAYAAKIADEVVTKTTNEERIRRGPMTPNIVLTDDHIARLRTLKNDDSTREGAYTRSWGTSGSSPSTFFYNAEGVRINSPKEMYFGTYEYYTSHDHRNKYVDEQLRKAGYESQNDYYEKTGKYAGREFDPPREYIESYIPELKRILKNNLLLAFESGWTKIDTSDGYHDGIAEEVVADAIREYDEKMGKRSGWKITSLITKFWPGELDLDKLQYYYADLPIDEIHILQHWPMTKYPDLGYRRKTYVQAYKEAQTYTTLANFMFGPKIHLGVSNFGRVHLEALEGSGPIEDIDPVEPADPVDPEDPDPEDVGNIVNQISQPSEDLIDPEPEDIGDIIEDIITPPEGWDEANPHIPEKGSIPKIEEQGYRVI